MTLITVQHVDYHCEVLEERNFNQRHVIPPEFLTDPAPTYSLSRLLRKSGKDIPT